MSDKGYEFSFDDFKSLIREAVEAGRKAEKKDMDGRDYYKDTEKVLYSYPFLQIHVADESEYIAMAEKKRSKDVVRGTISSRSTGDVQEEKKNARVDSLERTKREMARIEKYLSMVSDCEGYQVIEMKYFGGHTEVDGKKIYDGKTLTIEEIAPLTNMSAATVRRWRSKLVNRLKILLFGQ